jgi:RHS repeat-associated protein
VTNRSINGTANSQSRAFDTLGRLSSNTNKLGLFTYTYDGPTNRLLTLAYPGQGGTTAATANYTYLDNSQDRRLQEIKNVTNVPSPGVLLSQFDYTYDDEGQIKTWTKNYPGMSPAPQRYDLVYDNADQLTRAPLKNANNNNLITNYLYAYDLASNRTTEKINTTTTTSTPNTVNEIVSQSGGTNRTLGYDDNGSLTNDGLTRTFEWDAANRLTAINYTSGNRSEFTYDGLSRCAKIVEKTNGSVTSTRKFVWCGNDKCEFRDANDAVTLLAYPQGQYVGTTKYFYFRDHLGSIREMMRANGTLVARFDYDPWGRSTTVLNTTLPDFNFTGLYRHSASNLDMAVRRFYDPDLGRWLSRDPDGEIAGVNLYAYAFNYPIGLSDPSGLTPQGAVYGGSIGGFIGGLGGLILGGVGGTAVEPGGGTIGGIYIGETEGALLGAGFGAWLGDLLTGREPNSLPTIPPQTSCPNRVNEQGPKPPDDPSQSPGEGWEWRGNGPPGSDQSSWYNPETGESLHPDLNHPAPVGPHWDYNRPGGGKGWRIPPGGGEMIPKP